MKNILLISILSISTIVFAEKTEKTKNNSGPVYNFNFYNNASPRLDFGKKTEETPKAEVSNESSLKAETSKSEEKKKVLLKRDAADIHPQKNQKSRWSGHFQYHVTGIAQNMSGNDSFDEIQLHNSQTYALGVSYAGVKLAYGITTLKQTTSILSDASEKILKGNKVFIEYDQPIESNRLGFFGGYSSMQINDVLDDSSALTNIEIESSSLYLGLKYNYMGFNLGLSIGRSFNRIDIYNNSAELSNGYDGGLTQFEGNSSDLGLRLAYSF